MLKDKNLLCAYCFNPIKIIHRLKGGTAVCKRCFERFGEQDVLNADTS